MLSKKIENRILNIIGIFLIAYWALAIFKSIYYNEIGKLLWLCYIGLLLIGIGAIIKNSYLVLSQLNILLLPNLFWSIDFLYRVFTGKRFTGVTEYFFRDTLLGNIVSLEHIIMIPLGLSVLFFLGIKMKDAWKISFLQVFIVFILSRLFTNPTENINCVFENCSGFIHISNMVVGWFIVYGIVILSTNFLLVWIYGFFSRKKKQKGIKHKNF